MTHGSALAAAQQELTRLCAVSDVPEQGVKQVILQEPDAEFAVYKLDGEIFVTDDICTHGMVSLSAGEVIDGQIYCPLHNGAFDIRTGKGTAAPCRLPLKIYMAVIIGEDVFAQLS